MVSGIQLTLCLRYCKHSSLCILLFVCIDNCFLFLLFVCIDNYQPVPCCNFFFPPLSRPWHGYGLRSDLFVDPTRCDDLGREMLWWPKQAATIFSYISHRSGLIIGGTSKTQSIVLLSFRQNIRLVPRTRKLQKTESIYPRYRYNIFSTPSYNTGYCQ